MRWYHTFVIGCNAAECVRQPLRTRCIDDGIDHVRLAFDFKVDAYASMLGLNTEWKIEQGAVISSVGCIEGLIEERFIKSKLEFLLLW